MQVPDAVTVIADLYPGVRGYHEVRDGQDSQTVHVDPGHLVTAPHHVAGQGHVSSLRYRHVLWHYNMLCCVIF